VELLDERSKQYSIAGDDSVSETITDLVRGALCPAIKQVLEHGMKRPSFLGKKILNNIFEFRITITYELVIIKILNTNLCNISTINTLIVDVFASFVNTVQSNPA